MSKARLYTITDLETNKILLKGVSAGEAADLLRIHPKAIYERSKNKRPFLARYLIEGREDQTAEAPKKAKAISKEYLAEFTAKWHAMQRRFGIEVEEEE